MNRLLHWFDARLHFSDSIMPLMRHPVPRELSSPLGWWYVFGSASMTLLMIQIVTGIGVGNLHLPAADGSIAELPIAEYPDVVVEGRVP